MTIQELLEQYNVEYREGGTHHHVTQGYIGVDCPWCSPGTKKYRLGFNLAKRFFTCWVCGHCKTLDTLEALTGQNKSVLGKALTGLLPVVATGTRLRGHYAVPAGVLPLQPAHRAYLRRRGLDPHAMRRLWEIKSIGIHPQLGWSIWIPIILDGYPVSWVCRSIGEDTWRYKAAPAESEAVPAKSLLFGADYARGAIIICEGPFDVFKIGPGAVATLGVGYSKAQLLKMKEYPTRVVCFDNEPEAQKRAEKLVAELSVYPGETYSIVPFGKDAGEMDEEEAAYIRQRFLGDY